MDAEAQSAITKRIRELVRAVAYMLVGIGTALHAMADALAAADGEEPPKPPEDT